MLVDLENSLISWNKSALSENGKSLKKPSKCSMECIFCIENLSESEDDNIDKSIQDLREQENLHKEEAFNLVMRAGEEAMGAGAFAVSGMGIPAIIMGGKATYDFVEGCKEYNKGVECEEMADALENINISNEKSWWQFWK